MRQQIVIVNAGSSNTGDTRSREEAGAILSAFERLYMERIVIEQLFGRKMQNGSAL